MLNRIIRIAFALTGALTGYTVSRFVLVQYVQRETLGTFTGVAVIAAAAVLMAVALFVISGRIVDFINDTVERVETTITHITLYELILAAGGLIAGLIIANLISIPLVRIPIIGVSLSILINLLMGISGVYFALIKRHDTFFGNKGSGTEGGTHSGVKILDTSAIIDGRILDVCRTGFLEGELVIPSFVLEELRHLADSHDDMVRTKGRRGLDVLNAMKKDLNNPVRIERVIMEGVVEVDEQLLAYARECKGIVLTTDYNLGKVAAIRNISVLNINDLANAIKPVAMSGEEMTVRIIKEGKESGQGVGYLEDGTMVVVENAHKFKGQDVDVIVTSVLQTSAGRMIFAKFKMQHLAMAK